VSLPHETTNLCDELDDTTGLSDLLLGKLADPSGANNQGNFGETTLSEDLGVAERKEVNDRDGILLGAGQVGLTGLNGDERPELEENEPSATLRHDMEGGLNIPCQG
jgi:hypothetical protein